MKGEKFKRGAVAQGRCFVFVNKHTIKIFQLYFSFHHS